MPRRPRLEIADGLHHVTARAQPGRDLFHDDRDRRVYLLMLAAEIRERGWSLWTFCLMTNHVHLLIRTPEPDLGVGFGRFHGNYATYLNREHAMRGHVFDGRFRNRPVVSDRHALGCLRYIARNPVEAFMCPAPSDYAWSAHRALAGLTAPPWFLDVSAAYAAFDSRGPRDAYVRLVSMDDRDLVAKLAATQADDWLAGLVDDFRVPPGRAAELLGIGRTAFYGRLAASRDAGQKGQSPQSAVRGWTKGTVP